MSKLKDKFSNRYFQKRLCAVCGKRPIARHDPTAPRGYRGLRENKCVECCREAQRQYTARRIRRRVQTGL